MFKILIIAAAGFILFKLLTNDRKKKGAQREVKEEAEKKKAAAAGEMVRDPICGTYVPNNCDIRVRKDGQVFHFCSFECRDEFLQGVESGAKQEKNRELDT
ncbi:MAG: YHS domain-containing protein [Desulfonatronovibrionaceae bacterium]